MHKFFLAVIFLFLCGILFVIFVSTFVFVAVDVVVVVIVIVVVNLLSFLRAFSARLGAGKR